MPTAGRLAAASAFFLFGWYIGIRLAPFFPEGNPPDWIIPLSIGVAVLCGWMIVGKRAGNGYFRAISSGLTGMFAYSVWVLFLISFEEMIGRSLRRLYDGPMEAVVSVFSLMLDLGKTFFDLNLILSIVIGGIICALFAEYFGKRYS